MQIRDLLNRGLYLWKRNNWMLDPRSWLQRFEEVKIDRPIFLLGVQGGGLTLLSRMLRRHSAVVSVSGNYRYWSGADEMHTVMGPILPQELSGARYKVPVPDHSIFRPPRSWTYACDELLPYYRKRANDATPKLKGALERAIRMCIARHALDMRNARFVDKSQVYIVRVSLIRELLKEYNPKFVLVVNNPYAACYRAALGKAKDMEVLKKKLSFQERLEICAQHWANSIRCALEDQDKDMLIIQFEELIKSPEKILRYICDHVELDFQEDMIPAANQKVPFGSRFKDRWYPLILDRALHYINNYNSDEIIIVKTRCEKLAMELGYESINTF